MQLLGLFDAAVFPFGREPRLVGRQSASLKIFLKQRQVRFNLASHLALGAPSAEQIRQSRQESPHSSLVPQRHHRVHPQRPLRRDHAREHRDGEH